MRKNDRREFPRIFTNFFFALIRAHSRRKPLFRLLWAVCFFFLVGCVTPESSEKVTAVSDVTSNSSNRQPATLVPTYTPLASNSRSPESDLLPTAVADAASDPSTPESDSQIPADAMVIELRVQVPALALDRRLQGNGANELILVDETTGTAVQRNDQAHIVAELEQALANLTLEPLPPNCPNCVHFSYAVPFTGESGAGWLQDIRLLASLENFMTIALGPHLPPDTLVGLHRSASPYAPAHTVALAADGRVWRWLATDAAIADPPDAAVVAPNLNFLHAQLADTVLQESYVTACTGQLPVEEIFLRRAGGLEKIELVCPDYALPSTLVSLYLQLDALVEPLLLEAKSLEYPPSGFGLTAVVDYKRADGSRLTINNDGYTEIISSTQFITTTLTSAQTISLTIPLLESGELSANLAEMSERAEADLAGGLAGNQPITLIIRGEAGVFGIITPYVEEYPPFLQDINQLINRLLLR